jgi:predicted DNA-binding protein (MmcQ/YjbR family)
MVFIKSLFLSKFITMDFEQIQKHCLSMDGASEETPFGPETLVYKVANKMFALLSFDNETIKINLKNSPDKNLELRESHDYIIPGYHMNKKHWNTVVVQFNTDFVLLRQLILESYLAVLKKKG